MKRVLLSAMALAAMSSVAIAEPAKLSDDQLGQVAAGLLNLQTNINGTAQISAAAAASGVNVCAVVAACGLQGNNVATSVNGNGTLQGNVSGI